MPDPIEPKTAVAQPEENRVDIAQIKTMVDLPETASDVELITVLVNLIANLQEKYEGVLQDAVAMEDSMTNRDIADFSDVIDEASAPFWKEQILQNRAAAIDALSALRMRVKAEAAPAEAPRTIPLRNRLAAIERTVAIVADPAEVTKAHLSAASAIRNRAHELAKTQNIPFITAFSRAEKEINKD